MDNNRDDKVRNGHDELSQNLKWLLLSCYLKYQPKKRHLN